MRSRDGEHVRGGRNRADQVDQDRRPARRSSPAAVRGRRAGGSRTGSWPRPRSSSGRCCGRAARTRSPAGGRRRRRARARARRRTRERRAALRRTPLPRPAARSPPARATCAGSRPRGRSRRAGRSACRRRPRERRSATARGRTGHVPPGHDRGLTPPMSRPDAVPCRRSRAGASSGSPGTPRPRRRASDVGIPSRRNSCFSTRRSCEASRAAAPGIAPTRSAAPTGTFSNSYVTAAAPSASRSRSSGSSYSPTSSSPTSAAGASGEGSRKRNESPSGIPASASIRPSWPPPMTPTITQPGRDSPAPTRSAPRGSARAARALPRRSARRSPRRAARR